LPEAHREEAAPVRAFWSGTITFGLVSIPVDLFAAVRPRRKSMKMVDPEGHALGRQYHCPEDGKTLSADEIVRGYETDSGEIVVVTDAELESVAPEMSRDIDLARFVPRAQIPPAFYQRPYFLVPAGRSSKAYHLLARTMERTGRIGIGHFVMRDHEYLVAIVSEGGLLRAETLRFPDELRTPADVGLPKRPKVPAAKVKPLTKAIEALTQDTLDVDELSDRYAEALHALAEKKEKRGQDVIRQADLSDEDEEPGGAEVIDLMQVLRKSLSGKARVASVEAAAAQGGGRHRAAAKTPGAGQRKPARRTKAEDRQKAPPDLRKASKEALYQRATELGIAGRSKMDKDALLEAIGKAA
jgi:DNA end-binding protein Ku